MAISNATAQFLDDMDRLGADEATIRMTRDGTYALKYTLKNVPVGESSEPGDREVELIGADLEAATANTSEVPVEVGGRIAISNVTGKASINRSPAGIINYILLTRTK